MGETATGQEYIARQRSGRHLVPKGAAFYDVTDGLVDVATGRPLFEVGEAMLEKPEDAKTALRLMEGAMGLPPCFPPGLRTFVILMVGLACWQLEWEADGGTNDEGYHKNRNVAFRVLVGVTKPV